MPHDTPLQELSERLGILSSYISQSGTEHRSTSDETRVAILAAMGVDASTEARAQAALAELGEQDRSRIVAPVRVVREGEVPRSAFRFRVPEAWGVRARARVEYTLELRADPEVGLAAGEGAAARMRPRDAIRRDGEAEVGEGGVVELGLTPPVAPGYYELHIMIAVRGRASEARQRLIVVPPACVTPERRAFGIITNLYSVRGERSWGVGSLADLGALARWSGELGAAFVGVNPLHALRSVGGEISPYSPVSRLYRNPVYLDIESIPEVAECEEARALLTSEPVLSELALLRASDRVEYARKTRLARPILVALHRWFVEQHGCPPVGVSSGSGGRSDLDEKSDLDERAGSGERAGGSVEWASGSAERAGPDERAGGSGERASLDGWAGPGAPPSSAERVRAYAQYLRREGRALDSFALFTALDEHFSYDSGAPLTWQQWPLAYRDPHSPEVAAFARSHQLEVDFHRWVQFELDRQLGAAAEAGSRSGLTRGLYQDLAVASAPYGSDVWANGRLHATGVSIGAPPDNYSATGQNWGLSPLNPHQLFEDGYRFWVALIRSVLRHGGALRIDHVLGLFRQFWIPAGMSGAQGAYVRFPTSDLLGILALESVTHQAVIVGEDLGTVPPEVPGTLREWGILGTRVMLFEREADGEFREAKSYEPLSLATADTHDMSTLAGFWQGRDIELAAELGLLHSANDVIVARRIRQNDRRLLVDRLLADGALASASDDPAHSRVDLEQHPEDARASWRAGGADDGSGGAADAAGHDAAGHDAGSGVRDGSGSGHGTGAGDGTGVGDGSGAASPGITGSTSGFLPDATELRSAVHRFLCSTPAALVGISLDDLSGEVEPVNIPGVGAESFPSWTRRMRMPLRDIGQIDVVDTLGGCTLRRGAAPRDDDAPLP